MNQSAPSRPVILAVAAAVVGVIALLSLVMSGPLGRTTASAAPPVSQPASFPATPGSGPIGGVEVELDIATAHAVSVLVEDETGTLVEASSGRAGDGMSVRWYTLDVQNVDMASLRLTWVGLPRDDTLRLSISSLDGTYRLGLVQTVPPANSDALGHDRVLILRFNAPVNALDVQATIQEAAATQG